MEYIKFKGLYSCLTAFWNQKISRLPAMVGDIFSTTFGHNFSPLRLKSLAPRLLWLWLNQSLNLEFAKLRTLCAYVTTCLLTSLLAYVLTCRLTCLHVPACLKAILFHLEERSQNRSKYLTVLLSGIWPILASSLRAQLVTYPK